MTIDGIAELAGVEPRPDTRVSLFSHLAPPLLSRRRREEVRPVVDQCLDLLADLDGAHGLPVPPDDLSNLEAELAWLATVPRRPRDWWAGLIEHGDPTRAPSSIHKLRTSHG
ncbi:MAG: hypothetical protein AAFY08_11930 [Planctomycetota bacterium]